MTNDERMTKSEARNPLNSWLDATRDSAQNLTSGGGDSSFGLLAPFVIRHSASEYGLELLTRSSAFELAWKWTAPGRRAGTRPATPAAAL
jgi:hypothetical protein